MLVYLSSIYNNILPVDYGYYENILPDFGIKRVR